MQRKILFLTLRTFSGTGGIEKVSRVAGKALFEICKEQGDVAEMFSMYDNTRDVDTRYFPQHIFKGFAVRKFKFIAESVIYGSKCQVVVLSHINLLPVGYLIKLISPKTKLILLAHGIEVFGNISVLKRRMMQQCDQIVTVSKFTKDSLLLKQIIPQNKFTVLNNCVDPFLKEPFRGEKSLELLTHYGFKKEDTILMTLCRLSSEEGYKGYDIVIESLFELQQNHSALKYLIVGKYDEREKNRLDELINYLDLKDNVVFSGFIPDAALAAHFQLADIYIMPSEQEGFGIAFIEAMYYNKPVIAGNKDGSVDALLNGKLGLLVNPQSKEEVSQAIETLLSDRNQFIPDHQLLMQHFSYEVYKENWKQVLKKSLAYSPQDLLRDGTESAISDCTTSSQPLPSGKYPILTSQKVLE